jgi:hypothetical protein
MALLAYDRFLWAHGLITADGPPRMGQGMRPLRLDIFPARLPGLQASDEERAEEEGEGEGRVETERGLRAEWRGLTREACQPRPASLTRTKEYERARERETPEFSVVY